MSFKLRTIELTATGREIVRDRDIASDTLSIGRAAENDIHLPDLAVESRHATATALAGGRVSVKAVGKLGFTVDGSDANETLIDSVAGAELGFGTYRITVSRDGDAILLTVRQFEESATRSGDLEEKGGFSLSGVLPGKRIMSWSLVGAILAVFLALPVISHMFYDPADKDNTVIGDSSWSTGDLSLAHHKLEDQCEACHVDAFVSVRDETCISCHEDIHDHADPERLAASRSNHPFGQKFLWAVADTFGKEGPGSCADCHVEHEGAKQMESPHQKFCADCHGALAESVTDTSLGDASDFGTLHPQFTPAVVVDAATREKVRISLDKKPTEDHGLKFPHKLHLDPKGGAARMAANIGSAGGYGAKGMQCKDCHRPTEDGIRFKPIEMERDCEACHSLSYDKVGGIFRKLSHGDVDQLIADLSAGDLSRPTLTPRRRPGDYAEGRPYHFNFSGSVWKGLQLQTALSDEGICGECHRPAVQSNGKPGVLPVTLSTRYMQNGWFDHKAHKQEKCTSCHLAEKSDKSSDLLLPDIKDCRTCHLGEDAHEADVPSSCVMCHSYHVPSQVMHQSGGNRKKKG